MRIALVSQSYPPENPGGGIGTQTYLKARGLSSLGHEVHVIAHSIDTDQHELYDNDGGVYVTRIPGFDSLLPITAEPVRWLTYSVRVAEEIARLHACAPLDIIDFPEWGGEGYIYLLNRTAWNHIPVVTHLQGPLAMFAEKIGWPERDSAFFRIGTEMEGTCLRLSDAVFSSSRCSADWCAEVYGLSREKIPVIHAGVDLELFRPLDLPKDTRPTIIFVGKIERNKGVLVLMDAACELATEFPGLRLRLAGSGSPSVLEEIKAKASACHQDDLLEFLGYVPRELLPAELSPAHVFAAPSIYEGGPGFVYLEAMACGLPVIACEGSGASEVVTDGKTGLLVAPGNPESLKIALRKLLGDPQERERMGRRARAYVEAEADTRVCVKKIERFYESVVSSASRARSPQK